ncbi:site-specific DNA-methyltransferase [Helicobacter pylori]|uniref:site-specific DNA-methyltransferase n=1 Tax=Helicobacter pylori TaxID=210 RepID=UPI0002C10851|nr:site-specific DNA-methyltransferase [Helicobacter pylori]BAM97345.1 type III DNA modification enzyme [Helicobacter pylori OK113]
MQNKEIGGEKSVNERNLEVFNRYFPGCLSIENDDKLTLDVKRLKALLGDFSEIKEEGYGLDFVGKKIALNQAFKKNHKILKPLNKSTSKHILIKGDNLDALKILRQSYSEKIKMIYIDPPYNTKNDNFIYGDDFSQSNEEVLKTLDYSKEKLDYIKNLFGSKCHSGWLSFMYPRLLLAKDLLKQDGVIFISIDDNEAAQLKLLCDEIFGEGNFVADFIRKTKSTTNDAKTGVNYQHEFLLCYAKNKEFVNLLGGEKNLENYKNPDNDPNGAWVSSDPTAKSGDMKTGYFAVKNPYMGKVDYPTNGRFWRFSQNTMQKHIDEGHICFKKEHKDNERGFIYKRYLKDLKTTQKTFDSLIFSDNCYMNQTATKELLSLGMGEYFTYPKGVEFMKKIILHSTTPNSNDIILDFFAGSGTTAHAVLKSNKSDYQKLSEGGGGLFNGLNAAFKERRFILVQLDEKIDPKKNKSAHDFCLNILKSPSPSIFDITEERIKRAGAKIKEACPYLDVGFRAFEIIDDETNDKNLNEANQKDLLAYSNLKKRETQTILIKLLCLEGLELTTPITCLIENALYLALNTAFIVGDIEMSEVLENLKDKGVEKISMYMPAISNDRLCLELGSNLLDLKLESGDLKIRG